MLEDSDERLERPEPFDDVEATDVRLEGLELNDDENVETLDVRRERELCPGLECRPDRGLLSDRSEMSVADVDTVDMRRDASSGSKSTMSYFSNVDIEGWILGDLLVALLRYWNRRMV